MRVPKQGTGAEQPVVAKKSPKGDGAKGLHHPARTEGQPREREEPEGQAKPFGVWLGFAFPDPFEQPPGDGFHLNTFPILLMASFLEFG